MRNSEQPGLRSGVDVQFFDDAEAFLREAEGFLATDPLRFTVIATNADSARADQARDSTDAPRATPPRPRWFAIVRDRGAIVGVAMRTHPAPPHAGFVARMPPDAVRALAEALAARDEVVPAWNGDLDGARELCLAAAEGRPVDVVMHTRLHEAQRVIWPDQPPGSLRPANDADEALVSAWMIGFHHDSDSQGGREPDPDWAPRPAAIREALAEGGLWLWEVDGVPTHLSAVQPPMFGVARIGPVYTPAEHRGRGYAAWVVALLTQQILDAGNRPCLYTDQANPVSNKVYERIGYEAVHDEGNVIAVG